MSENGATQLRNHLAVLQEPLPLEPQPFLGAAKRLGMTQEELLIVLKRYLDAGVIRRIAGVIKHNRAGFTVNAMVAMAIDPSGCDASGEALARFPFISHLYRRTSYPDWPYTIYAMVHARSVDEFRRNIVLMRDSVTFRDMVILRTLKEYKKTAFRMGEP